MRKLQGETSSLLNMAESFTKAGITKSNVLEAGEVSQALVSLRKSIVGTFKPIKHAIDEAKRAALEEERKFLVPVEQAEKALAAAFVQFRESEDEAAEAARLALVTPPSDSISSLLDEDEEVGVLIVEPPTKIPGVSFRECWRFELLDESKLVRAMLQPDHAKLQSLVDGLGPAAEQAAGEGSIKVVKATISVRRGA